MIWPELDADSIQDIAGYRALSRYAPLPEKYSAQAFLLRDYLD